MKLIIDIPDELYEEVKNLPPTTIAGTIPSWIIFKSLNVIRKGTVLPKGHGNLIDKESLIKAIEQKAKRLENLDTINGLCGAVALAYEAETVIEADKEE